MDVRSQLSWGVRRLSIYYRETLTIKYALGFAVLLAGCTPHERAEEPVPAVAETDLTAADSALRVYLEQIRSGHYEEAMSQYDGEWRSAAVAWFEGGDTLSGPEFLREACKGLLFCHLAPGRTVESTIVPPDTARFVLELREPDGRRFEPPPHGGGNERDTLFAFTVAKTAKGYRMLDLPVYRP